MRAESGPSRRIGVESRAFEERLRTKLDAGLKAWIATRGRDDGLSADQIDSRVAGAVVVRAGDLVSDVMSFGAPTPVEVQMRLEHRDEHRLRAVFAIG